MIYTINLCPTIDFKVEVDSFDFETSILSKWSSLQVGGKGILISEILNLLSVKNKALAIVGGETKSLFLTLLKKQLDKFEIFEAKETTRINFKGFSKDKELSINSLVSNYDEIVIQQIKTYLENNVQQNDYLVFAGLPPLHIREDIYAYLIKDINKKVRLVIDTKINYIKPLINTPIFLLKVTLKWLEDSLNKKITTLKEIHSYCLKLKKTLNVENLLFSFGNKGSILYYKDKRDILTNESKIHVVDTTGTNCAMIGGFLGAYVFNKDIIITHKWSLAAKMATCESKSIMAKERFEYWLKQI